MFDLISVIIPIYNIEPYLDQCLESVCQQTYRNFEVILIDDGSTDGSWDKCQEYEEKYMFIQAFQQEHKGVSEARNMGIKKAQGKYIAFVDGDDTVEKNYLEVLERHMATKKYDIVFCACCLVDILHNEVDIKSFSNSRAGNIRKDFFQLYAGNGKTRILIQSCCSKLLQRELIEKNNIRFDRRFINGEDAIFMLHYLSFCPNYYITNETKYNYYRYGRGSATDLYSDRRVDNEIEHLKFTEDWLNHNHIQHAQEIMSFDIAGITGGIAEALIISPNHIFSSYTTFKHAMKLMQRQIKIPKKAAKIKTAILLWCIKNKFYLPIYIYQWGKNSLRIRG